MASNVAAEITPANLDLRPNWRQILVSAFSMLGTASFFVLIGLFGQFAAKWLIVDVLDIGHMLLLVTAIGGGMVLAGRSSSGGANTVVTAAAAGLLAGALLVLAAEAARAANIRWMLVSLTPQTLNAIGYRLPPMSAAAALGAAGAIASAIGACTMLLPPRWRRTVCWGLGTVIFAGLLRELIRGILQGFGTLDTLAFSYQGMLPQGAVAAAIIGAVIGARPGNERFAALPVRAKQGVYLLLAVLVMALPALTNDFVAQVMLLICLYTLMGMGLNIELGLAGLVDLGFVAFFAVGAYSMAILTSTGADSSFHLGFFQALPFSILFASCAGFIFGLPVLKVRGDYLAIATLGLGEIVRVLVLSDMMKPLLGGAQGIVGVPKPSLFGLSMSTPTMLFYLTAAFTAFAGYCAWRLQHSGLGRRWLAVREDEDVAQALGINLVMVKLYAYTMGAAFAGLAGGIFAAMVGSAFPQSFQLLVSINVLAILVVGGIGSLPGVVIGAAALIGAPEVLRDLGDYRYLIYGIVIIAVVRLKPEGLSPVTIRRREAL